MVRKESKKEIIKCTFPRCFKKFTSISRLQNHLNISHVTSNLNQCIVCFKNFSSRQNKIEHIRIEHSYSTALLLSECIPSDLAQDEFRIPKLTWLLRNSYDPDIRPFMKIERIFLLPDGNEEKSLPPLTGNASQEFRLPLANWMINNIC